MCAVGTVEIGDGIGLPGPCSAFGLGRRNAFIAADDSTKAAVTTRTVRNLNEASVKRLRVRGAKHGLSEEAELHGVL